MLISGIQKFTLLDFPDTPACIVFTPGCNFRCGYCHNPEFVLPEMIQKLRPSFIPENTFFHFLEKRIGLLGGVVISGGEPTLMPDLVEFIHTIKSLGFAVKLDTNGGRPQILEQLLNKNILDYIALDVKTSLAEYPRLVGPRLDPQNIQKSITLIQKSNIPYEFRTTLIQELHSQVVLEDMVSLMNGAQQLFLQTFRPQKTFDQKFQSFHPFSSHQMQATKNIFQHSVQKVAVR